MLNKKFSLMEIYILSHDEDVVRIRLSNVPLVKCLIIDEENILDNL